MKLVEGKAFHEEKKKKHENGLYTFNINKKILDCNKHKIDSITRSFVFIWTRTVWRKAFLFLSILLSLSLIPHTYPSTLSLSLSLISIFNNQSIKKCPMAKYTSIRHNNNNDHNIFISSRNENLFSLCFRKINFLINNLKVQGCRLKFE